MAWTLTGRLVASSGEKVSLAECLVEVSFLRKGSAPRVPLAVPGEALPLEVRAPRRRVVTDDTETVTMLAPPMRERVAANTDANGGFSVELVDRSEFADKSLDYVVSAPSGETIASGSFSIDRLKDGLRIPVRRVDRITLKNPPPEEPASRRITGKIIERNGKPLPANLQVLLFARKRGEKESKVVGDDAPLFAARADATGYFAGDVRNEEYEQVTAIVGGVPDEIPVRLEKRRIPTRVLLLIQLPDLPAEKDKGDCDCNDEKSPPRTPTHDDIESAPEAYSVDLGTGRCVQFNTPNRAIEEFDFYSVVRTTEPAIRGFVSGRTSRGSLSPRVAPSIATVPAAQAAEAEAKAKAAEAAAAQAVTEQQNAEAQARGSEITAEALARAADATNNPVIRTEAQTAAAVAALNRETATRRATLAAAAATAAAVARNEADVAKVRADAAAKLQADADAARAAAFARDAADAAMPRPSGRARLDAANPVDWDLTPTFYEAATIAHGHLLHFKQVWYADGYSLGDLLYSLPLGPGQKKLVSVVDWERRERAARAESTFATEDLTAALTRDRDLGEVVTATLTESSRGGSRSTTAGIGVGTGAAGNGSYQGFNFGALVGVSGGYGESNADAWMDSARTLASDSLQTLRDRTLQSASAIRGLRSSVVQTVSQGEAVRATTEVVANHNHCHALTIQYFEVLRHLKLSHELADVQECLFVPLPMSEFDLTKILRWRQPLETYLQRKELAPAFDSARRVEMAWSEGDFPLGRYGDELVTSVAGELTLTVLIPLPPFPERPRPNPGDVAADSAKKMADAVNPTTGPLGMVLAFFTGGASLIAGAATNAAIDATKAAAQGARALADEMYPLNPEERYRKFHQEVMPGAVEGFVDQLELWALVGSAEIRIGSADFTLVSDYAPATPLTVSVRASAVNGIRRGDLTQLVIKSAAPLPPGCRAIVNGATFRYRTKTFEHALLDDRRVNDDIDLPKAIPVFTNLFDFGIQRLAAGTGAALFTPLDAWEQRNPRIEDWRLSVELLEHLNDNVEFYHHAIWWTMDPNRRYMLLDGYLAPGSKDRSVASVVENRLIGIVGNSLVMPVARGAHLNPRFRPESATEAVDLREFYSLSSPVPPARVSLPTRGVFAEAVMGSCNACERVDESRFWRWQEAPIDEPPAIEATSTATRRAEPATTSPTAFPSPMVSIQNAPPAPDPAGLRAALDVIGRQTFRDITGLEGSQANSAAAYSQALDTAFKFGKEASTLAQQAAILNAKDKTLGAIDSAEQGGQISADDAKGLRMAALRKMVGDGSTDERAVSVADRLKVIDGQEASGGISSEAAADLRTRVMRGLDPEDAPGADQQDAATEAIRRIPAGSLQTVEHTEPSGATTSVTAKSAGDQVAGAGQSALIASEESTSAGGTRRCYGAFDTAGEKYAAALGLVAHVLIQGDAEKMLKLERGATLFVDDQASGGINPKLVRYLLKKNPNLTPANKEIIRKGPYKRPDFLIHDGDRTEMDEIKPDSVAGRSAAVVQVKQVEAWMRARGLPYVRGTSYAPGQEHHIRVLEFLIIGLPVEVTLKVRRLQSGIVLYKYCFKYDFSVLVKGAVVAFFLLLLAILVKYVRMPIKLPTVPIPRLPPGSPDLIVIPPIKQPASLEATNVTPSIELRAGFETLDEEDIRFLAFLVEDQLPPEMR